MNTDVHKIPRVPVDRMIVGERVTTFVVTCPFCGKIHYHGNKGNPTTSDSYSSRGADCGGGVYELIQPEGGTVTSSRGYAVHEGEE